MNKKKKLKQLLDAEEDEFPRPTGADVGSVTDYFEGGQKYIQYLKQTVDEEFVGIHVALRLCTWCYVITWQRMYLLI